MERKMLSCDNESETEIYHRIIPFAGWLNERLQKENLKIKEIEKEMSYVEIDGTERLYEVLVTSLVSQVKESSCRIESKDNVSPATKLLEKLAKIAVTKHKTNSNHNTQTCHCHEEENETLTQLSLGLGLHTMTYKDETVFIVHQTVGQPECGEDKNPKFFHSLVLLVQGVGRLNILRELCDEMLEKEEKTKDKAFFKIYRYWTEYSWWRYSAKKVGRHMDTVILPKQTKKQICDDFSQFLNEKSIEWYFTHGIPYKRSYLFYGVPGSGKSSLIQALAAKYERNLCFLQPTHPKMTDDNFKRCIQRAPANSLIVLEDIDALFNKDRSKKHKDCPLTFSGLLNGLDGVGNPDGQIFILTTNFIDRLDSALIRSGRVDLHIEFPMATNEQIIDMFHLFYPNADCNLGNEFVLAIRKQFKDGISMAAVQQHFISNMFKSPQTLIDQINEINERMDVINEIKNKDKKNIKDNNKESEKQSENSETIDNEAKENESENQNKNKNKNTNNDKNKKETTIVVAVNAELKCVKKENNTNNDKTNNAKKVENNKNVTKNDDIKTKEKNENENEKVN